MTVHFRPLVRCKGPQGRGCEGGALIERERKLCGECQRALEDQGDGQGRGTQVTVAGNGFTRDSFSGSDA